MGALRTMEHAFHDLLDHNRSALVFLDARKRLVHANQGAHALADERDGIKFTATGLVLAREADNQRLQQLIGHALAPVTATSSPAGGMRVARPSGKRDYVLQVMPVAERGGALSWRQPALCIVITDPERQTAFSEQQLQSLFELTGAEARLACRLVCGEDLGTAAAKLGITYGTARARLSEIFQKTNTHRQAVGQFDAGLISRNLPPRFPRAQVSCPRSRRLNYRWTEAPSD